MFQSRHVRALVGWKKGGERKRRERWQFAQWLKRPFASNPEGATLRQQIEFTPLERLLRGNPCRRILAEDEWKMLENSIERPRTINVPAWPGFSSRKNKIDRLSPLHRHTFPLLLCCAMVSVSNI